MLNKRQVMKLVKKNFNKYEYDVEGNYYNYMIELEDNIKGVNVSLIVHYLEYLGKEPSNDIVYQFKTDEKDNYDLHFYHEELGRLWDIGFSDLRYESFVLDTLNNLH